VVAAVDVLAADVIVIVDVLRFTTAVEAATGRGGVVYPFRWRDEAAALFAESVGAEMAGGSDPLGPSLSPLSLLEMEAGQAVVLPSPNGSVCAVVAARTGATVAAACLRNATAVADWARSLGGSIGVIACGELSSRAGST
jgi:2-phosphosulfolactate phosphatase